MAGNGESDFVYQQSRQARSQWQLIKPVQVEFHLKVPHLEDTNRMRRHKMCSFYPFTVVQTIALKPRTTRRSRSSVNLFRVESSQRETEDWRCRGEGRFDCNVGDHRGLVSDAGGLVEEVVLVHHLVSGQMAGCC